MATYIKNGFVSMDWRADLFLEDDDGLFVAAVNPYIVDGEEVGVAFMDGEVFSIFDPSTGKLASPLELLETIAECVSKETDIVEYFEDQYVSFTLEGVVDSDNLTEHGLGDTDVEADINDRLDDLSIYWREEYDAIDADGNPVDMDGSF